MFYRPARGVAIEGAFDVVGLKGDHFADKSNHLINSLAGCPYVLRADSQMIYVGMKNRC
jgi:hypothetical protein